MLEAYSHVVLCAKEDRGPWAIGDDPRVFKVVKPEYAINDGTQRHNMKFEDSSGS